MKKKLLLTVFLVLVLFCALAVATLAADVYRTERTYNYYENEIGDGNLLFQAKTIYAYDNNSSGKYRFEIITESSGVGFAKFDAEGNALTWYVISNDHDASKDFSTDEVYTQNIVVKCVKTIGTIENGGAGTIDANGAYTYNDGISSKMVVSANFFGTGVKTLPQKLYMAESTVTKPNGNTNEYAKLADGSYLLALYLPKTLTAVPNGLCVRTPLITLEFEDNTVSYTELGGTVGVGSENVYPFAFCPNIKRLVLPEGLKTIHARDFREAISLEYIKFPNSVTSVPDNVLFRGGVPETVIYGENTTFAGYLDGNPYRFYVTTKDECFTTKYYYLPTTINSSTLSKFCAYRGGVAQGNDAGVYNITKYLIFFVSGTLDEAKAMGQYCDEQYRASYDVALATSKGLSIYDPITYETYISNKEYYDNELTGHLLVYNVPKCVAHYEGNHNLEFGTQYIDTLSPIIVGEGCTRCDYGEFVTHDPIITALGYSAQINGDKVCVGYNINNESLALVQGLEFGMLVTVPTADTDMTTYEPISNELTLNVEKGYMHKLEGTYVAFELVVTSFSKDLEYYDFPVVMCAFVSDGESVDYLSYVDGEIVQTEYATSTTFRDIALDCETAKVTYSCDATYGTLSGSTEQNVMFNEESTPVTAVANEGYEFACWSDGTTDPTITVTPEDDSDIDLVAYFTPKSTGLPVMTINTENGVDITTKEYYINCEITLLDTETGNSIGGEVAEIKGRGNSTWDYAKKPYKFKFESKQNLFGYGKEKTWVLLADHRDYSLLRNMLALNAGLSLSELSTTSKGQSVELYLNGEYRGVYYLCEQIQVKENRVNITEEEEGIAPEDVGYLLELDGWAITNGSSIPNLTTENDVYVEVGDNLVTNRRYAIKDPEDVFFTENGTFDATKAAPYLEYIQAYLKTCLDAVQNNDGSYTYEDVCALVDVKSFAQSYIIQELFKNPDTNYSSVYYYKDKGGKLICGPLWDFDMSLGNQNHKDLHGVTGAFTDPTVLWSASQNPWYKELLQFEEFKALVASELAENQDTIRASIADTLDYARAHADAYKKNFEKWDIMGTVIWSNPDYLVNITTWEEHVDFVKDYLNESLDALLLSYPAEAVAE